MHCRGRLARTESKPTKQILTCEMPGRRGGGPQTKYIKAVSPQYVDISQR